MSNTIQKELLLPQPPDLVWPAIATSAALAEWMFPNNFEARVGHQFTFQVPPNPKFNFEGLTVHCEVLACEPPKRLAFSWSAAALANTQVSFRLESHDGGTRLLFEHTGFDLTQPWGKQAFKGAEFGWANMLGKLADVVAGPAAGGRSEHSPTNQS